MRVENRRTVARGTVVARSEGMMKRIALVITSLMSIASCATETADRIPFDEPPMLPEAAGGKGDVVACTETESCEWELCGYDCTTRGAQCTRSCAAADTRPEAFVASNLFDSRMYPYEPRLSLDDVIIYGCRVWDLSDGTHDALDVQFQQLIHASIALDPDDPARHGHEFRLQIDRLLGPGSYRANGLYQASHDAPEHFTENGCAVDVASDGKGGLTGRFDCELRAAAGGTKSVAGTFGCGENATKPIFVNWAR
jgi:hypothetical protein